MEFKKYNEIENSYRDKFINSFNYEHNLETINFVMLEKIHGSNVQFMIDKKSNITKCSKNQILGDDDNFQGGLIEAFNKLDFTYAKKYCYVLEHEIRLFGELFGKGIQRGIKYFDDKRILFFDAEVDGRMLPFNEFVDLMRGLDLPIVPIVAQNLSLNECLSFDVETFKSIVNKDIEGENIAEGVVIRPIDKEIYSHKKRLILKQKCSKMSEKERKPKIIEKDPLVEEWKNKVSEYITENRMLNLFSKVGTISEDNEIGKYMSAYISDVIEDFLKDYPEFKSIEITKNQSKQIYRFQNEILQMLRKYL